MFSVLKIDILTVFVYSLRSVCCVAVGVLQPGKLKCVQAIGWYLEEANMAQVSVNITDHEVTPLHVVYEEVCKEARVARCTLLHARLTIISELVKGFTYVVEILRILKLTCDR